MIHKGLARSSKIFGKIFTNVKILAICLKILQDPNLSLLIQIVRFPPPQNQYLPQGGLLEILSEKWLSKAQTFKGKCEPKREFQGELGRGEGFKAKNLLVGGVWITVHNRILKDSSETSSLKILGDHQQQRHSQD